MKYITLTFLLFLSLSTCFGQEGDFFNQEVKKHFLIVCSTKDYSTALEKANSISEDLKLKLDLRKLLRNDDDLGLTWEKTIIMALLENQKEKIFGFLAENLL